MKDQLGHGSNAGTHAAGTKATPQLQRRHFEAIAADLKSKGAKPDEVNAMADKLATTNPGFRRDFFVAAATGGNYRNKGPGNNPTAVSKQSAKFQADYARGKAEGNAKNKAEGKPKRAGQYDGFGQRWRR